MSTNLLLQLAESGQYKDLFRKLGWGKPAGVTQLHLNAADQDFNLNQVGQYRGLAIWVAKGLPARPVQRTLDQQLAKHSTERLLIFHAEDQQDWRWPRHSKLGSVNARLMAHRHITGQADPDLEERLKSMRIGLDESPTINEVVARMRLVFDKESESASAKAARLMGSLYEQLSTAQMDNTEATQLLARMLFLWFGDDAGMWQEKVFHTWVAEHTTGENFHLKLSELFQVVNDPRADQTSISKKSYAFADEYQGFRYINGGLFAEPLHIPFLGDKFRSQVLEACAFDWSIISPAIFGSMFQTVKDAKSRRSMGEHYTTEENILKTLRPLFLDELEEELNAAWNEKDELTDLHKRLGTIRLLDPACGCGNFLIVAYRELRALELRLIAQRRQLDEQDGILKESNNPRLQFDGAEDTLIKMSHFAGIEIEEWPATIAETAMLLVDHLANQAQSELLGISLVRLPIDNKNRANIIHGNALRTNWAQAITPTDETYIVGNPPFLGHATRSDEQAQELRDVWGMKNIGRLDYVTAWYVKASDFLNAHGGKRARFAFVSTNSVSQGEPVAALHGRMIQNGWRIRFAYDTFPWTSEASDSAAVHCVIIGYDKEKSPCRLFKTEPDGSLTESTPAHINGYLVGAADVIVDQRRSPLCPDLPGVVFGNMPRDNGNLIVEPEEYDQVAADPIAAAFLRPFVGARELLHSKNRWCLWLTEMDERCLTQSKILQDRTAAVRTFRQGSSAASTREMANTPHLFGQRSHKDVPHLIIPRSVSERREYFTAAWMPPEVIASDAVFTAEDPDGFLFAVVNSSMFITWQKAIGGRLKSDIRFSNTIVWNNLPLPPVDPGLRQRIIEGGQQVLAVRDLFASLSLADLYDPNGMPAELRSAHEALDTLVDQAFGATLPCANNEERLQILFTRYQELTANEGNVR